MDNLLVQSIDDLLRQKIPNKSSMSGADYIPVYPDNTQSLDLNNTNTYRIRLPKYPGFLARSKGQTGPFFTYAIDGFNGAGASATYKGEPWAFCQQMRILVNGVEVHNCLNGFNHVYAEWLKKKRAEWLLTDASNSGVNFDGIFEPTTTCTNDSASAKFVVPLPDNYSILSNKNHAVPLEHLDILIEITLNNHQNFLGASADGANLGNAKIKNLVLYIPVVKVDPEVSDAINMRLMSADTNEEDMLLFPIEDIRVDRQTFNYDAGPGTKTYVFNSVNSMCRLLEAKFSQDPTDAQGYKTMTGLNPGVQNYSYIVDGKRVIQNPVSTASGGFDLAYALHNDLVSAYNSINNDDNCMGVINKARFNGTNGYPNHNGVLESSFSLPCNLDTVSKDLVGGAKIINNLSLEVNYQGGAVNNCNLYLIQHSNRVIAVSRSRCKVLK